MLILAILTVPVVLWSLRSVKRLSGWWVIGNAALIIYPLAFLVAFGGEDKMSAAHALWAAALKGTPAFLVSVLTSAVLYRKRLWNSADDSETRD